MEVRNYCEECKGWTLHEAETGICCKCEWDEGDIIKQNAK